MKRIPGTRPRRDRSAEEAEEHDIPPVPAVARDVPLVGGRAPTGQGKDGDSRDPERIQDRAHHISAELAAS